MNIFFHHVGQNGAKEDFKKTIYNKIPISFVEKNLPDNYIYKNELIDILKDRFPLGEFNCWGVPEGAKSVIKNLNDKDYVFLVESSRIDGEVPVLCHVKLFWREQVRELSQALWGQAKFPYIFFFDTEKINLMWLEFRKHINYKSNFQPRGNFYKVKQERFSEFGGAEGYIRYIVSNFSSHYNVTKDQISASVSNEYNDVNLNSINKEFEELIKKCLDEPSLTDALDSREVKVNKVPRDNAFAIWIKEIYEKKCAICGMNVLSPKGYPEVQAAHIYPKSKNGSDDLRNGICLCHFHHWALDVGWIAISDEYKVLVKDFIPKTNEYSCIYKYKNKKINLPNDSRFNPHKLYLRENRKLNGFE